MVVVPGAGHSVYFERPEAFNRIALEFLDGARSRAGVDSRRPLPDNRPRRAQEG
jgi:hypothetical protein